MATNHDHEAVYDVFVSYRWVEPDQTWVREQLAPSLQAAGLKVCLDVNDFIPGRDVILEMERAAVESRKAICVISPDYFEGNRMAGFESLLLQRHDPTAMDSRLIPLILRDTEIPPRLSGVIAVDFTGPSEVPRQWQRLLQVLHAPDPHAAAPAPLAPFPRATVRASDPIPTHVPGPGDAHLSEYIQRIKRRTTALQIFVFFVFCVFLASLGLSFLAVKGDALLHLRVPMTVVLVGCLIVTIHLWSCLNSCDLTLLHLDVGQRESMARCLQESPCLRGLASGLVPVSTSGSRS